MKRTWITGISALLCIGFLFFGNRYYHGEIEETRAKAYKEYTEDQESISLAEAELEKERQSIGAPQQKKLQEAHKAIKKVYDDSKHKSSELKEVLQDLTPLIEQKDK